MKYVISIIWITCFVYANNTLVDDKDLGLRKTPLNDDNTNIKNYHYNNNMAGESKIIQRAYENAPPMIPHDVDGMLEITKDYNACLGCHLPSIAPSLNATPIPESHLYNLRTNKKYINDEIDDSRYNCNLCHTPQANLDPVIGNNFKPEFRNLNLKNKSNLMDVINEGIK